MNGIVFFLLAAMLLVPAASSTASTIEDDVRGLESARREALLAADTTAIARMTADDFVEISRLGAVRTKSDNLRELATGTLKLTSVKYDSLAVRVYGKVAVPPGHRRQHGHVPGHALRGEDSIHAHLHPARRAVAGRGDAAYDDAMRVRSTAPGGWSSDGCTIRRIALEFRRQC